MKTSIADAAGMDASPTGAALDTHAPAKSSAGRERHVPSRPPTHQLPIRHGHIVRRRSPTASASRSLADSRPQMATV
jgi:hypothetical protein